MSGLEDEQAKATAKNEHLLYLARKYYTKWQTLPSTGKKVIFLTLHEDYHHLVEPFQSLFPHSANVKNYANLALSERGRGGEEVG